MTVSLSVYIAKRLLYIVPVLLLISSLVFLFLSATGDITAIVYEVADAKQLEAIRRYYGLDQPLHIQYLTYLEKILRGEMGRSLYSGQTVISIVLKAFPATLLLALSAGIVAIMLGFPLGIASAVRSGSAVDDLCRVLSLLGVSLPAFFTGLMLILVFSLYLRILPPFGYGSIENIVLPMITLGLVLVGNISRITRSAMLEVMRQDYIRTARSKGLKERVVIYKHALKNAMVPIVSVLNVQIGHLLGGAVVTETVFGWPGLGRVLVQAILVRDVPVALGGVLFFCIAFVLLNLFTDVLYTYVDPRVRY